MVDVNIPTKKYLDIDMNFTLQTNGDILILQNEDAVKQSVRNIILTMHHEKRFEPFFGSNIRKKLFDLNYPTLAFETQNYIIETLKNYEPRVSDVKVNTKVINHRLEVNVNFSIISISKRISLNIELERLR